MDEQIQPLVGVIMGSDSDFKVMEEAGLVLKKLEIPHEITIVSAHRTPLRMMEYDRAVRKRGLRMIIAGADGAAHLPGTVAAHTILPVADVALNAAKNAGILAAETLSTSDDELAEEL